MKTITFRPLRRIKKTGKITVASYMQWRKVKTADYSKFKLIVSDEYKSFPKDELVYNHNGENLFWRNYNPEEEIQMLNEYALVDGEQPPYPRMWKTDWGMYSAKGLDCDGVPAFSHETANEIVKDHTRNLNDYSPLTVEVVNWWFGWFLYQLQNNELEFILDEK
jgi:hypothetical protein